MLVKVVLNTLVENKDEIVDELNKRLNIPFVGEEKEEAIYSSIFDGFIEILGKVLNK